MVNWNSTTDQVLLLKIIETSSVSINAEAIAAAWPSDHGKCTPTAIQQRIFKIRKSVGLVSPRKVKSEPKKAGSGVKKKAAKRNGRGKVRDSDDTDDTDFGSVKNTDTYASDENNDINTDEVFSPSRTTKRGATAAAAAAAKALTSGHPVVIKPEPADNADIVAPLNDEAEEITEI
ncbi:hypothetical protein MMC07_003225 [Pseudocyphellaria aurata]|nr:hypothetical protein [Pseudocyphellaria aurata]